LSTLNLKILIGHIMTDGDQMLILYKHKVNI